MTPRRTDQARDFVRKAICSVLASKTHTDPADVALNRYGNTLEWNRKAGVSSMVSGSFASETQAFFDSVAEQSVIGKMPGLRRVPFHARLVSFADDGGATASWTSQGQGKPVTRMTLSAQGIEPRKVSALAVFSDELLRDTQGETLIMRDLQRACADAIDLAFLSVNAETASTPGGLLEGVTPVVAASDIGGSLAAWLDDFTGALDRAVIVGRPGMLANLAAHGFDKIGVRGGELLGVPTIASRQATANALLLIDAGRVAIAGGEVEIRSSQNASIEMESAPAGTSYEAGSPEGSNPVNIVSMLQTNCVAVMCETFVNWKASANSVSSLDASAWGGTSP